MKYCANCGKERIDDARFCADCGAPVGAAEPTAASVAPPPADSAQKEQEFLDMTHRLLRWERKAWRIESRVLIIVGIVFAALFSLFALVFMAIGDEAAIAGVVYFVLALLYGALFVGMGLLCKAAANKTVQYLDRMYTDFRPTLDRCGSVGMLVFEIFFGEVALIFFLINFIRIKSNAALIGRILARQQGTTVS